MQISFPPNQSSVAKELARAEALSGGLTQGISVRMAPQLVPVLKLPIKTGNCP